jgi:hypothetical protein
MEVSQTMAGSMPASINDSMIPMCDHPRAEPLPAHMSCRQGLTNACGIDVELNCGLAPREHVALEIGRDVESKSGHPGDHPGVHLGRRKHLRRHEQRRIKCIADR